MQIVTDPDSQDSFEVPEDWTVLVGDAVPAEAVVALEPGDGEVEFRANVVLSVASNDGLDFVAWQESTEAHLPGFLDDYQLLDREDLPVAGVPGGRRLARYTAPDGTTVTMEQWFCEVRGVGHTLTATMQDLRYAEMKSIISDIVDSFTIGAGR